MFEIINNEQNHLTTVLDRLMQMKEQHIVLYGAGYCGHEALTQLRERKIPVFAVCDDYRMGQELDGFPISSISDIVPDDSLIIFVTSGFNESMIDTLKKLGLYQYYLEADFGRYEPKAETYSFFSEHRKDVEKVYNLLSDDFSKRLYVNLIQYRISRKISYLNGMMESTPQYYPDSPCVKSIFPKGFSKHAFLDLGAYDGDSIRDFIKYVDGEYESIIAVEASEKNYKKLNENCRNMESFHSINIGISDTKKQLRFNVSDAKNSYASETGEEILNVDSVDNILNGTRVSFIKMDIEGAEYEAIKGARNTIVQYHPIMAVSIYHSTEDLFRLCLEVEKISPGSYDYYLRHYSPTVIETVLYTVPKDILC